MTILANRRSIMTLFSDDSDAVGHCVRIVLAEKDINVDVNFIDMESRPEDLVDLNPYNSVLTLIDRDLVLYDAQIMMEYLDERFPHPPLMPVDPIARANNRQLRYRIFRDLYTCLDDLAGENEIAAANGRKAMRDHLTAIAPAFRQNSFFVSDDYSLVDCCLAPLLWRLNMYNIRLPSQAKSIIDYSKRLFDRPSFQASLSEREREIGSMQR